MEPVRVEVAYGEFYAVSGMTTDWTQISVKVKNLAYDKRLQLHCPAGSGMPWVDRDMNFLGHYGEYDIFGGSLISCEEFAVKYLVSGQEYWDNNNGFNYHIGTFRGAVGGNVMLNKAIAREGIEGGGGFTFETSWLEGEIYVQNLSYHKKVGIRYTKDGGLTWQDSDASYFGLLHGNASNIDGVEIWKFKTPTLNYDHSSPVFKFAVYYEMRDWGPNFGRQFWDNNFTQDYILDKSNGSTLE